MSLRVALLIYPGFQLLDAAGPIAAFEIAERCTPGSYSLRVIAAEPGLVASSSGASMHAVQFGRARDVDTLLVAGGDGSRLAVSCTKTRRFIQDCAIKARRTASVCSGSYLLACAGLLDGKRATTHWNRAADFARKFPTVHLQPDCIFVNDGCIWTSAGISAGIDLSLALIEDDLGESIARRTDQQLVYLRRPGGQSQFSALLEMQRANGRLFHAVTGMSPAKAIEQLRAETARGSLANSGCSVQEVARPCGFGNVERMRRTFVRLFGAPPSTVKYHAR